MRIVRGYLLRTVVAMTLLVMAVLLGLAGFIEFVGQLDDVGIGDFGIPQALLYAAMKLPALAFVMLPMAALIGALLGLGSLANHSELTALRAAGVSVMSLARSVAATGAVLAFITLLIGVYVAPPLEQYSRQFRTLAQHGQSGMTPGQSAWIREGNTIINVSQLNAEYQLGGVYLFRLDPRGRLAGIGRADSAGVDDANQWILNNFSETRITGEGVSTRHKRRTTQSTQLSPELIELTVIKPDYLDGLTLYRYAQYLESNGLEARRLRRCVLGADRLGGGSNSHVCARAAVRFRTNAQFRRRRAHAGRDTRRARVFSRQPQPGRWWRGVRPECRAGCLAADARAECLRHIRPATGALRRRYNSVFGTTTTRVRLSRSCQVRRSGSMSAQAKPSPSAASDRSAAANRRQAAPQPGRSPVPVSTRSRHARMPMVWPARCQKPTKNTPVTPSSNNWNSGSPAGTAAPPRTASTSRVATT